MQWLEEQFQRTFTDVDEFLKQCGQAASFGGGKAIWGVRVAAAALIQFELYQARRKVKTGEDFRVQTRVGLIIILEYKVSNREGLISKII